MIGPGAWDVVVVGGGPAGSATGARLARAGFRVLLLDRSRFPRDKACGECVNPAGVRALARLGVLERVRREAHAELQGWRVHPVDAEPFEGAFPAGERGLALPRRALDAALLEHARECGVKVRTGARVSALLREGSRVMGVRVGRGAEAESLSARLVVGADGLRSVVARELGALRRPPRLHKLALTAHVRGVDDLGGRGELHLLPWGCLGVAAVGNGVTNLTVVLGEAQRGRVAGAREEFFDWVLEETPRLAGARRVSGVLATGPFDFPVRGSVADGALLVGDAAGYYDPFTGQGIYRALRGAELAAEVAGAALHLGDTSARALAPYDRARRAAFGGGEHLQRVIEGFVAHPALMRHAAGQLRRRPALADALFSVIGDLRPVRSLLRPSLLLRW